MQHLGEEVRGGGFEGHCGGDSLTLVGTSKGREMEAEEQSWWGAAEFTAGALTWRIPGDHPRGGIWEACRHMVREMRCWG